MEGWPVIFFGPRPTQRPRDRLSLRQGDLCVACQSERPREHLKSHERVSKRSSRSSSFALTSSRRELFDARERKDSPTTGAAVSISRPNAGESRHHT